MSKLVPLLASVLLLSACNSPQRFEANHAAARQWLAAQAGKAGSNLTGKWKDATRDDWGNAELVQRGNKISGTLGVYEVEGVVNGPRVSLALKTDDWYYYSVEAIHKGASLEGFYSRGVPIRLVKGDCDPFSFRRADTP